jgi:hypothetical protein
MYQMDRWMDEEAYTSIRKQTCIYGLDTVLGSRMWNIRVQYITFTEWTGLAWRNRYRYPVWRLLSSEQEEWTDELEAQQHRVQDLTAPCYCYWLVCTNWCCHLHTMSFKSNQIFIRPYPTNQSKHLSDHICQIKPNIYQTISDKSKQIFIRLYLSIQIKYSADHIHQIKANIYQVSKTAQKRAFANTKFLCNTQSYISL